MDATARVSAASETGVRSAPSAARARPALPHPAEDWERGEGWQRGAAWRRRAKWGEPSQVARAGPGMEARRRGMPPGPLRESREERRGEEKKKWEGGM